jgi:hypothetical protein
MNPSGSQGTQCIHQDFSSRRRHGYISAERIHVCIPGHTGWILGSYLRDIFQSRHSSFVTMTQLENHMSQPCLTDSIYTIFWVILFNFCAYLPMGVLDVYFVDNVAKVPCWRVATNYVYQFALYYQVQLTSFCWLLSIRCATVLPMGVAPEAIAEIFGYRLKRIDKLVPYTSSRVICRL